MISSFKNLTFWKTVDQKRFHFSWPVLIVCLTFSLSCASHVSYACSSLVMHSKLVSYACASHVIHQRYPFSNLDRIERNNQFKKLNVWRFNYFILCQDHKVFYFRSFMLEFWLFWCHIYKLVWNHCFVYRNFCAWSIYFLVLWNQNFSEVWYLVQTVSSRGNVIITNMPVS